MHSGKTRKRVKTCKGKDEGREVAVYMIEQRAELDDT
jgi:hypothetical protein